jgi:hypothetical protein
MPDLMNNTQQQNNSTSDGGTNRRASKSIESCFVLETSAAPFTVSSENKFGAITDKHFRTTSKIVFSGTAKVYSPFSCQVAVQPNLDDATKVNLILKPFKQPMKGLALKYIILRGINKTDIIDSNNKIAGSASSGTDFVQQLWENFNQFYSPENTTEAPPPFTANFIGYPDDVSASYIKYIDAHFFKISVTEEVNNEIIEDANTAYELPIVPMGMHLGFATNYLGVDVVLDHGSYYYENDPNPFKLNLEYARKDDFFLDTDETENNYHKRLIRQSAMQFIDYAAFLGLHALPGSKLHYNGTATHYTEPADIFALMNGFSTKNTQYLYIQSNRQRSYNFYGNYLLSAQSTIDFKIGDDIENLQEVAYGDLGWPVHTISNNEPLCIKLVCTDRFNACMYLVHGNLTTDNENNFVRQNALVAPVTNEDLADENYEPDLWTLPIGFYSTEVNNERMATFNYLIYEGAVLYAKESVDNDPENDIYHPLKDIDDLFGLIGAKPFVAVKSENEYPAIIDERLSIASFKNSMGDTDHAVIKIKQTYDAILADDDEILERVTWETLLVDGVQEHSTYFQSTSCISESQVAQTLVFDASQNNYYQFSDDYGFSIRHFTSQGERIKGLYLIETSGNLVSKLVNGVSKLELDNLIQLNSTIELLNCAIFFKPIIVDDFFVSAENIKYKKYSLELLGEDLYGELALSPSSETILMYAVDLMAHHSRTYSSSISEYEDDFSKAKLIHIKEDWNE